MSGRTPLPRDRVRYVVEGVVTDVDDLGLLLSVLADGDSRAHYVPRGASVEVLDDPSRDLVGTIRQSPDGVSAFRSDVPHNYPWIGMDDQNHSDKDVTGWEVTGVVPRTPAADEQQAAEEQRPEPRVFSSDGPEPPEDVDVLVCVEVPRMLRGTPYLKRIPESRGWAWVADPRQKVSVEWGHSRWPISSQVFSGEFREVLAP